MSKTWETLFNLTGFMKYLLTKDLPEEKLEAPLYVLDSLYDLLYVTSAWIDKIKPLANDKVSLKNQLVEHSAETILSSRSNKSVEVRKSNVNVKHNYSTNDFPSVNSTSTSACYSKEELNNNEVTSLENVPEGISEVFLKLNKEMVKGRPSGHYCRPCDSAVFSKKDWENHMTDRLHSFLMEDCEIKYGSCVYCKLVIFASNRDANKLFKYHELEHHTQNNFSPKETTSKTETNTKPSKSKKYTFTKTNSDVAASRSADTEVDCSPKINKGISPVFIELDKKMHSGKEKGFYCHICDKAFDAVAEWNMHFQEVAVHNNEFDSCGCFEMCDSCSLVIFAEPSIQKWYKSHHLCGHYTFKMDKNSNFRSSVESLQSTSHSQENSQSYKNNVPFQNNQSYNTYKIAQQFQDFNAKIHGLNLHGYFYCRPCNASLSSEEWNKHSVNKKHLELMASKKFKNWKGVCTYCFLTIIGTRDTVKYYMQFHSVQHNKVASYDLDEVSSCDKPNCFIANKSRTRKERITKIASSNSESTLGDEENKSYLEDNDINNSKNERSFTTSDDSGVTSWYASSREEQFQDSIRQLIESRTNEKYTSGDPQFGALCTICEYDGDDAFDWQDHLSSSEHCQRIAPQDRQAYICDLNIYLFANINVLEKYKSLFKGDWSFIEN